MSGQLLCLVLLNILKFRCINCAGIPVLVCMFLIFCFICVGVITTIPPRRFLICPARYVF